MMQAFVVCSLTTNKASFSHGISNHSQKFTAGRGTPDTVTDV